MGIEALVAREVRDLGYECEVENGKVTLKRMKKRFVVGIYGLRTADRVKIKVGEFKATTFDELFEKTKALMGRIYSRERRISCYWEICEINII